MKTRIAIIHFQPLEYYPPIQNIIRFLQGDINKRKIHVITTETEPGVAEQFISDSPYINIIRLGSSGNKGSKIYKVFQYFYFNVIAFFKLCLLRPTTILYFETISSFPVYIYKRYINRTVNVLIHYHEYTSPAEYISGMKLVRKFHLLEHYLYPFAAWVSHTNQDRMSKFLQDILPVEVPHPEILPNYPPAEWQMNRPLYKANKKLRIVYAGALGLDTMYIKEFAEWVHAQGGSVEWDIYSQQEGKAIKDYILSLKDDNIRFKGSITYRELPATLYHYDIGVILYKGHIPNYIYNAPNKLFEYLACGLDVWFPEQMKGSLPYVTKNSFPKVIPLNFEQLGQQITKATLSREGMQQSNAAFNAERELPRLLKYLN